MQHVLYKGFSGDERLDKATHTKPAVPHRSPLQSHQPQPRVAPAYSNPGPHEPPPSHHLVSGLTEQGSVDLVLS